MGKPRGKATGPLIHATGSLALLLQLGRKAHVHATSRDAAEKMGLISTEAENLLDFHELRQVLSTYTVTSGTV